MSQLKHLTIYVGFSNAIFVILFVISPQTTTSLYRGYDKHCDTIKCLCAAGGGGYVSILQIFTPLYHHIPIYIMYGFIERYFPIILTLPLIVPSKPIFYYFISNIFNCLLIASFSLFENILPFSKYLSLMFKKFSVCVPSGFSASTKSFNK